MARRSLTVREITDDPLVNRLQDVGSEVIREQPGWERRKNTLTAGAQLVLQVGNLWVAMANDWPWWAVVLGALVIGVAEMIIHAGTKAPVTPSVVERLSEKAVALESQKRTVPAVRLPSFSAYLR